MWISAAALAALAGLMVAPSCSAALDSSKSGNEQRKSLDSGLRALTERMRKAPAKPPRKPVPGDPKASFTAEKGLLRVSGPAAVLTIGGAKGEDLRLLTPDSTQELAASSSGGWWSLVTFDGQVLGPKESTAFVQYWDTAARRLSLKYTLPGGLTAWLQVVPTAAGIRMEAAAASDGPASVRCFRFPNVTFPLKNMKEAVFARLGGVALQPGFFEQGRRITAEYPSDAFADFLYLRYIEFPMAMYVAREDDPFWPARLVLGGAPAASDAAGARGSWIRDADVLITPGSRWSAPIYEFAVGGSVEEALSRYAKANRLDKSPTLAQKVGPDKYDALRSAILLNLDFDTIKGAKGPTVFDAAADKLADLPHPLLVHPLDYWEPAAATARADISDFDANCPDYLPARRTYGGNEGFQRFCVSAHALGNLVMPYTNPTCWDEGSATWKKLGAVAAATGVDGKPQVEQGKVTISPKHPAAIEKNRANLTGLAKLGSDFVFESQVGGRPNIYDCNEANPQPANYAGELVEYAATSSKIVPVMTERGFDALMPYESGFCGIGLGAVSSKEWDDAYGKDNWRVYPVDTFLASSYAALYHRSLGQFVTDKDDLSWSVARGCCLQSYLGADPKWLRICEFFQRYVCSRYVGRKLKSFEYPEPQLTKSVFDGLTVVANHSPFIRIQHGQHATAPQGFVAYDDKGDFLAGVATSLFGQPLEREAMFIEERQGDKVFIQQIESPDGDIFAQNPSDWPVEQVRGFVVFKSGKDMEVPITINKGIAKIECYRFFTPPKSEDELEVDHYELRLLR